MINDRIAAMIKEVDEIRLILGKVELSDKDKIVGEIGVLIHQLNKLRRELHTKVAPITGTGKIVARPATGRN